MTTRLMVVRIRWLVAAFVVAACGSTYGQTPSPVASAATGPKPGEVEAAPISCWWRADRSAIRVGERFTLVLTCGVIEAGATTVVANVNQLEAGALSITPFEAVSGVRGEDVVVPPRRYFQFEYTVRLLSDGFFGKDVEVPPLRITYNIQAPGGTSQGRDRTYVLPALPMRVLAIVPESANDIRDSSGLTFAEIEARRFRASAARLASVLFFAFAGVLVAMGLVGVVRERRTTAGPVTKVAPASSVLAGCLRALADIKEEAGRGGWTPDLARRALGVLRIGGAQAIGRTVAQQLVSDDAVEHEGQLAVRSGWIRRRRTLVSAATTPRLMALRLERGPAPSPTSRQTIERMAEALEAFNRAAYARSGTTDASTLDSALDHGVQAIRRLRAGVRWPMRSLEMVTRPSMGA